VGPPELGQSLAITQDGELKFWIEASKEICYGSHATYPLPCDQEIGIAPERCGLRQERQMQRSGPLV
jgi:hypothetical protein